jgi:hypothetical protein
MSSRYQNDSEAISFMTAAQIIKYEFSEAGIKDK